MKNKIKEICKMVEMQHIFNCTVKCTWSTRICRFDVVDRNIIKTMRLPYLYVKFFSKSTVVNVLNKCLKEGYYDSCVIRRLNK